MTFNCQKYLHKRIEEQQHAIANLELLGLWWLVTCVFLFPLRFLHVLLNNRKYSVNAMLKFFNIFNH